MLYIQFSKYLRKVQIFVIKILSLYLTNFQDIINIYGINVKVNYMKLLKKTLLSTIYYLLSFLVIYLLSH